MAQHSIEMKIGMFNRVAEARRKRPLIRVAACALLGSAAFVIGCGESLPRMAPVSGVVELDGKPISDFQHAAVILTPTGGRMAKGVVNPADGSFQLSTYETGDGAITGPARVAVSATVDDPTSAGEKHPGVRWLIPEHFADSERSGLTCEVLPGKENKFRIKITSAGAGTIEAE